MRKILFLAVFAAWQTLGAASYSFVNLGEVDVEGTMLSPKGDVYLTKPGWYDLGLDWGKMYIHQPENGWSEFLDDSMYRINDFGVMINDDSIYYPNFGLRELPKELEKAGLVISDDLVFVDIIMVGADNRAVVEFWNGKEEQTVRYHPETGFTPFEGYTPLDFQGLDDKSYDFVYDNFVSYEEFYDYFDENPLPDMGSFDSEFMSKAGTTWMVGNFYVGEFDIQQPLYFDASKQPHVIDLRSIAETMSKSFVDIRDLKVNSNNEALFTAEIDEKFDVPFFWSEKSGLVKIDPTRLFKSVKMTGFTKKGQVIGIGYPKLYRQGTPSLFIWTKTKGMQVLNQKIAKYIPNFLIRYARIAENGTIQVDLEVDDESRSILLVPNE